MSTALRSVAMEATYEDLQLLVYQATHKIATRYQIPFEDLLSEAHCCFVRAFDTYTPEKGASMSSWVYSKVTWGLQTFLRKELRHHNQPRIDDQPELAYDPGRPVSELYSDLSDEAQEVVRVLLESPKDFSRLCRWNDVASKDTLRETMSEHLQDRGWSVFAVRESFQEIAEALEPEEEEKPEPPPPPCLRRLNTTRKEIWLVARVGLTPSQVRHLLLK